MKFGFDIDDTLINLREYAFHLYNKKLKQDVSLDVFNELKTLEIHEAFGLSKEEGNKLWNSLLEEIYYSSCPPFPHAVETLQELDRQGHEIYYITARVKEHGERTMKWLKGNDFPIQEDHFYYGMDDTEKVHVIEKLGLDYYFDDKPAVLETLSNLKLQVFAKDTSYNRHLKIPRITSWLELNQIIKGGGRI
ncbi:5' nucleotidase, NT5C type [Ammoniphilus resinae]|uniref:Nucleotidase n=1 Tax=Ammoniphilus resinae TaxID=861532 RepID=A0ABS4GS42_9BACL|nr:HAD family acid phosphatase [Ammoniphilus resinae]MBP1933086.1 putative HAD superfamily protein [Ammoniphilus resinae]